MYKQQQNETDRRGGYAGGILISTPSPIISHIAVFSLSSRPVSPPPTLFSQESCQQTCCLFISHPQNQMLRVPQKLNFQISSIPIKSILKNWDDQSQGRANLQIELERSLFGFAEGKSCTGEPREYLRVKGARDLTNSTHKK